MLGTGPRGSSQALSDCLPGRRGARVGVAGREGVLGECADFHVAAHSRTACGYARVCMHVCVCACACVSVWPLLRWGWSFW